VLGMLQWRIEMTYSDPAYDVPCHECNGDKEIECPDCEGDEGHDECPHCGQTWCERCNGSGMIECPTCDGSGEVSREDSVAHGREMAAEARYEARQDR